MCLGFVAAVTACAEPEPDDVETGEAAAALLANPTIPRGATWKYWDRGVPDQTWWGAYYYDDAAWAAGAGPLGYGESYVRTTVSYGGNASNKHVTTYFRYSFDVADPARVGKILAEVMFDDAFAVRLNDIQIAYDGFPAGWNSFSHTTLGVGHEANNAYQSYDWTAARGYLRPGRNTIAVEVHQSEPSSSDLVFDLSLALEEITLAPGVAVPRRSPIWEYSDIYQSFDGSTEWAAPDRDGASFTVGGAPLGYGESYLVTTIRRPTETWQSPTTYYRHAFQIDDPDAVSELRGELMYDDGAVVFLNGLRIDALSMPPGDEGHAALAFDHEANNAYVSRDWSAFRSYLREGENVIGVALHQNSRGSSDAVFDLSLSYRTTPPVAEPTEDIARGAIWTYWDRGGDLGTTWRAPSYDDAAWRRGPGPLGYGESYLGTTVEYGPDANNKYRTTYFRNRFRVADRTAVASLVAEVMYDDGAVIYLNGTEVKRLSMPAGTITASTFASGHEGGTYERHDLSAARNLLVDGDNVITVEVHQNTASSSDLVFDLALDVSTSPGTPPPSSGAGIARGSSWRYLAALTGPSDRDWTDSTDDFADDHWPIAPGPLGYGESYIRSNISYGPDPANKYMTTYFRNSFVVEDPAVVSTLVADLMYDDGIIVYLNGNEVVRRSMPSGSIDHDTPAIRHEANNAYETVDLGNARQYLVPGRNWVAVRVHQDDPGSSDLVFDLAMRVETHASRPTISRRAPWLYYDRGPLAAGWQTSADTSGWDGGHAPFGYNHGGERTGIGYDWAHDTERRPRTTYFRRHFHVASAAAVTDLRGELRVDDGAVVYVNGHEVQRVAMPSGAVTFDTAAAAEHDGTTYEAFDWSGAIGRLRTGENVIAIEVHQAATDVGDERDLMFDASLEVITSGTPRVAGCTPTTPTPDGGLSGVWIAPGGVVWASAGDGMIGRRALSGNWAWCRVSSTRGYSAVWGSGDDDVWFAGNSGEIDRWNGSGFTTVDVGSDAAIADVWGTGPNDVFAVGGGGLARHFDGNTWHVADVPRGSLTAVWGASAADVWAVGIQFTPGETDYEDLCESTIYRWDPASASFFLEHDFDQYYGACGFEGISGSGPDEVWAVGEEFPAGAATGYGMAANNTGGTWHRFEPSLSIEEEQFIADRLYTDVAVRPTGNEQGAWITALGDTAVRWDGRVWSEGPANTEHLIAIDHRGMQMFAVGYPNKVLRWNGTTWLQER